MGVIHTQYITHGTRGLFVLGAGAQAQFRHGEDDTPLNRLEAIGNMRQGAIEDDVHGIVQVGLLGEVLEGELFVRNGVHMNISR